MPVDPDGKLIANKYATPINRKPKHTLRSNLLFYGCLVPIATVLALVVCTGLYGIVRTQLQAHPSAPVRHTDWPTLATFTGADMDATTKPLAVSGTWQVSWHCGDEHVINLDIRNAQEHDIWLQTVSCLPNDTDGFALVTYTGQIHIEIGSVGSWVISIQEP